MAPRMLHAFFYITWQCAHEHASRPQSATTCMNSCINFEVERAAVSSVSGRLARREVGPVCRPRRTILLTHTVHQNPVHVAPRQSTSQPCVSCIPTSCVSLCWRREDGPQSGSDEEDHDPHDAQQQQQPEGSEQRKERREHRKKHSRHKDSGSKQHRKHKHRKHHHKHKSRDKSKEADEEQGAGDGQRSAR